MKKPANILGTLASIQTKMAVAQKELEAAEFPGEASQGLVKVVIAGTGELKRVAIDPAALTEDAETVEALVLVAFSNAYKSKEAAAKASLAKAAGGLLPMGMKIPGLG